MSEQGWPMVTISTDTKAQDEFLLRARVELFTAAQVMKGERLSQFRNLLRDVLSIATGEDE